MSLQGLTTREQLSRKLIDIVFSGFAGILTPAERETVCAQILSQLEEDPYLQGKLDRLSGLLDEAS